MIDDKILMVCDYPLLKNEGGPKGYFNKCIVNNLPHNVHLLNEVIPKKISIQKKVLLRLDKLYIILKRKKYSNKNLANKFIKIEKYKFLYFHDMYSFYDVIHLIKKDQVVLFQSHAPEIPSLEVYNIGVRGKKLEFVKLVEKRAFERANYLILPNKQCLTIYSSLLSKNIRVKYLRTGIKPIGKLQEIYIDENKINLFYIGRRNEVKGFPLLLKTFKKVLKERDDIRLYIAGNGEKIDYEDNIIDLGATNIAHDWINNMDYVISPNKTSYFDLNIIESIAIGTPLIMTTTEGHSFFKNKIGIIPITYNNFYEVLIDKSLINKNYKKEVKKKLLKFYKNELSSEVFKKQLRNLCDEIISINN
ncbi:glycosyltransferase [Polaribacter septentrionalilitoris]|uniref:glycosyltransferase n=1 Tax=Polaribacter septentrionalilitoris TaxID=2494657 RepID=UPI00135C2B10|nr:glycosyltransferase [Polaribacter septentrionalilitoris]